jgi:type I restriction enzyme S subunit
MGDEVMGMWELLAGWECRPLDEIAPANASQVKPCDFPDQEFHYLGLDALPSGGWVEPTPRLVKGIEVRSNCIQFDERHVLYTKLRPYLNKVVVPTQEGIGSTEFVPLMPDGSIITREFLAWYLRSPQFVDYAVRNSTGARMPRIRMSALWQADIPLPPLDEQRRIVARIEELFTRIEEARRLRAAADQDADELMTAELAEVFPDPENELPKGWHLERVAEISEKPQYGYTQSAQDEPVGPKFLRITDIQDGQVNWETVPFCPCTEKELEKYRLEPGDIVFARSGATTGKTFLVEECPEAVFASYLIRLKVRGVIEPAYVYWFFQSPYYWKQVRPRGAAQPNMNAKILSGLRVPILGTPAERCRIVEYLDGVQAQVVELKRLQAESAAELERLSGAVLARAFRGEL